MPTLKPSEEKKYNDIIYFNIKSRCDYFGCKDDAAAGKKIGIKKDTFYSRRDKGNWKSNELIRAAKILKVPVIWLWTDHSKVEEVKS